MNNNQTRWHGAIFGVLPSIVMLGLALGLALAKGPLVFPYHLSWGLAGQVVLWLILCAAYLVYCMRRPLSENENHYTSLVATFMLLPFLLLLEIHNVRWPAEPGTGAIYKIVAKAVAVTGTAAGTFALLAVLSNRVSLFPWVRGIVPYLILGAFYGKARLAIGGGVAGVLLWIVILPARQYVLLAYEKIMALWRQMSERKRLAIVMLLLFGLSFLVRIAPGYYIFCRCGYIGCGIDYYQAAVEWLDGKFTLPMREPGTTVFFYLAMLIGGKNFLAITVAQCLLGATVPLLTFFVARRCFPMWLAWSVTWISVFFGRQIVYSYFLGSENLQTVTVLLAVLASLRCIDRPGWKSFAVMGLAYGVSCFVKPSIMPLAAAAFLVICWRNPLKFWVRSGLSAAVAGGLVLAAWFAADIATSGGKMHFTTRFVNEFVLSNHPLQVNGINWEWDHSRNAYDILRQDYGFVGDNPDALENNLYTSGLTTEKENLPKVIAYRLRHPGKTIHLVLLKLKEMYFRPFICPNRFDFQFMLEDTAYYWFGRIAFLVMTIVGLVFLGRGAGGWLKGRLVLAMGPITYMILYVIFSPSPRNNMPVVPFMMMFIVFGFHAVYATVRSLAGRRAG